MQRWHLFDGVTNMHAIERRMSDSEFIQHLWITNYPDTNTIVSRMTEMTAELAAYKAVFGNDIEDAEINYHQLSSEVSSNNVLIEELQNEIERLKARTVPDLINEVSEYISNQEKELSKMRMRMHSAQDAAREAEYKEKQATDKLQTWTVISI